MSSGLVLRQEGDFESGREFRRVGGCGSMEDG